MQDQRVAECCRMVRHNKHVEGIWRRKDLKVPVEQPEWGRIWDNDDSCVSLRPEYRNHVWSYYFAEVRTHDRRKIRNLYVVDEFIHECLTIRVARNLKAIDIIDVLSDLFILPGEPGHIRSDNGPESAAKTFKLGSRTSGQNGLRHAKLTLGEWLRRR